MPPWMRCVVSPLGGLVGLHGGHLHGLLVADTECWREQLAAVRPGVAERDWI